jgi:hypothetical protein
MRWLVAGGGEAGRIWGILISNKNSLSLFWRNAEKKIVQ